MLLDGLYIDLVDPLSVVPWRLAISRRDGFDPVNRQVLQSGNYFIELPTRDGDFMCRERDDQCLRFVFACVMSSEKLLVRKEKYFAGIQLDAQTGVIAFATPAIGQRFLDRSRSRRIDR